jgi:hypothetical protein
MLDTKSDLDWRKCGLRASVIEGKRRCAGSTDIFVTMLAVEHKAMFIKGADRK